jgi:hypothetical protein
MADNIFEVLQDKDDASAWRVELLDTKSGDVYIAVFYGPSAETRAIEYAGIKNAILKALRERQPIGPA